MEQEEGHPEGLPQSDQGSRRKIHPDTMQSPLFLQYAVEKASAWYVVTYDPSRRRCGGSDDIGLRSFPWVAAKYLTILKQLRPSGTNGPIYVS